MPNNGNIYIEWRDELTVHSLSFELGDLVWQYKPQNLFPHYNIDMYRDSKNVDIAPLTLLESQYFILSSPRS